MRILYLDCFSGISGDMAVSALVDAGVDRSIIERELAKLNLPPFHVVWSRVNKNGISSLKFDVIADRKESGFPYRHYTDIVSMILRSDLPGASSSYAMEIILKIAAAEAKLNQLPMEQVPLPEQGTLEAVVEILSVAIALDALQADRVYASSIPLGSGIVRTEMGFYPVPAPATLEMMRGIPIAPSAIQTELTTRTGAGIVSGITNQFVKGIPEMIMESVGYGAGARELAEQPNVLRAVIGRTDNYLGLPVLSENECDSLHESAPPHQHSS